MQKINLNLYPKNRYLIMYYKRKSTEEIVIIFIKNKSNSNSCTDLNFLAGMTEKQVRKGGKTSKVRTGRIWNPSSDQWNSWSTGGRMNTNKLRGVIAERGMTQRQVAAAIGMTERTFYTKMKKKFLLQKQSTIFFIIFC